jgi:hypothetical protein
MGLKPQTQAHVWLHSFTGIHWQKKSWEVSVLIPVSSSNSMFFLLALSPEVPHVFPDRGAVLQIDHRFSKFLGIGIRPFAQNSFQMGYAGCGHTEFIQPQAEQDRGGFRITSHFTAHANPDTCFVAFFDDPFNLADDRRMTGIRQIESFSLVRSAAWLLGRCWYRC